MAPDAGSVCGLSECMVISIFPAVGAVVGSLSFPCGHSPRSCSPLASGQAGCGTGIRAKNPTHMWGTEGR